MSGNFPFITHYLPTLQYYLKLNKTRNSLPLKFGIRVKHKKNWCVQNFISISNMGQQQCDGLTSHIIIIAGNISTQLDCPNGFATI